MPEPITDVISEMLERYMFRISRILIHGHWIETQTNLRKVFQNFIPTSAPSSTFGCKLGMLFSLVSAHKFYIFSFCGGFRSQILYNFYEAREITQTFSKFCICYQFILCHL
jgi:hypothetical protein